MAVPPGQRKRFGDEMKRARLDKGWTLKRLEQEMAKRNEGITTATLSNWETGKFVPREIQTVHVLDHVLEIAPKLVTILGYAHSITDEHLGSVMRTLESRPLSPEDMRDAYALIDWPDSQAPVLAVAREITRIRAAVAVLLRATGVEGFEDLVDEAYREVDWDAFNKPSTSADELTELVEAVEERSQQAFDETRPPSDQSAHQ